MAALQKKIKYLKLKRIFALGWFFITLNGGLAFGYIISDSYGFLAGLSSFTVGFILFMTVMKPYLQFWELGEGSVAVRIDYKGILQWDNHYLIEEGKFEPSIPFVPWKLINFSRTAIIHNESVFLIQLFPDALDYYFLIGSLPKKLSKKMRINLKTYDCHFVLKANQFHSNHYHEFINEFTKFHQEYLIHNSIINHRHS